MMRLTLALFFALIVTYIAIAQTPVTPRTPPREAAGYYVVAVCGTLPAPAYVAGTYAAATIDVTGKFCVSQ